MKPDPDIKFIAIEGTRLAYIEKNPGAEKTIFFVHGNSISHRSWHGQLAAECLQSYRLVALDLPAHGDSGEGIDPATCYTIPGLAGVLRQAIQQLCPSRNVLVVAVSLGTNIVAEMDFDQLSPCGIVLLGPCIVGTNLGIERLILPGSHVAVVFTDDASEEDVNKYAREVMLHASQEQLAIFLADYHKVKKPFRTCLSQSIEAEQYSDEIANLKKSRVPLLVVFGNDEKVIDPDYLDNAGLLLWNKKIIKIPGASHLVHIDAAETVNRLISGYAADRFK